MAVIRIHIEKATQETTVSVECRKGSSCLDLTADLEKKVAGVVSEESRTLTEEFYEEESIIVGG